MTTDLRPTPMPGAVVVPDDQTITADAIARLLQDGGLRVLAQTEDVLIAERAIPGEPLLARRVVLQRQTSGAWSCGLLISHRRPDDLVAYRHDLTARRDGFTEMECLERYVGGLLSLAPSRAEAVAIVHSGPQLVV